LSEVLVISGNQLDLGFRLAGVEAVRERNPEAAGELLHSEIQNKGRRVIIVDSRLFEQIPPRAKREALQSLVPMVLSVPMEPSPDLEGGQTNYVQQLVRRAVGFSVKI
jgi:vacuolar-type H+-ATPase subunit F/Vma7